MTMEGITQEIIDAARKLMGAQYEKIGKNDGSLMWAKAVEFAIEMKRLSQIPEVAGPSSFITVQPHTDGPCKSCGSPIGHLETCDVFRK